MKSAAALVVVLLLGGCSWLYDTSYEEALYTAQPVEPPPSTSPADDISALAPYVGFGRR